MTYNFRRAIASEAKPLVGLYSESGGGKTHSALLLAAGFVAGDMSKVAMVETESGRGEAWADDPVVGGYQVISLREEFSPATYGGAIAAAEKASYRALIIDSASHEWEGVGGVLAMAAKNQEDGKKGVLVWQQPKIMHSREFMLRLQQTPIPLVITCMRAKYSMEQVSAKTLEAWDRPGKPPQIGDWIRSSDLSPKQSDDILFEMFVHGWLDKDEHRFHGTKYTIPAMREIFVDGQPITVDTGKRLAAWASGRKETSPPVGLSASDPAGDLITADQCANLETMCQDAGVAVAKLREKLNVERLAAIKAADYQRAVDWVARVTEAKRAAASGEARS